MSGLFSQYEVCDWYEPNAQAVAKINAAGKLAVAVFHAPWCGDCVYTIPLVRKIMGALNLNNVEFQDIEVDRSKKDPKGLSEKYKVSRIPTLILLRDGKELCRVVEAPNETIEQDFAKVL